MYGIAQVALDGTKTYSVDLYSSRTLYRQAVWSSPFLAPGEHMITLAWTGTKRSSSTGTNVNLDAVDVIGILR